MFAIHDTSYRLCDGLTRREWLRIGGLSVLGLTLPGLLRARAAGRPTRRPSGGKAKACILLWLSGGPPQHETWDPKPDAPEGIRGDLKPIASRVVGLQVGELMPRIAALADKCCVFRAVSTKDDNHYSSQYWVLTGQPHNPPNTQLSRAGIGPNDWPSIGSVVKHLRAGERGRLPAAITLPEPLIGNDFVVFPGQQAGFLGRAADPWLLTCDPAAAEFSIREFSLPEDVPPLRLAGRQKLAQEIDTHLGDVARSAAANLHDTWRQQAFDLLRSSRPAEAFDLDREPAVVRDRYGRHKFGQSVLLARRLVEAGVSLVQVNWPREKGDMQTNNPCWDTHAKNSERLKTALMPPWDQAYAALLEDLAARGLLEETLVVCLAEFGRTPRFNATGGRDHWGSVFSAALAGGGVKGGQVIGASDRIGAEPRDGRVLPQDLTATIFHCLGYSPDCEIHDTLGRPQPISRGKVIEQAL
jgi:Protein of unknown function (DUF1501)